MSPHISHVVGQIYALEGGAAGFARHVHNHMVALREKDEACYAIGKMYIALMNLTALSTKLDQEVVNLDDIDDEGLKKYLKEMLVTKMTKEEAVRYIQEANAEVESLTQSVRAQREEQDAEKEFAPVGD
jgi:predicted amino acid-binding ACT domain protein